MLLLLNVPPADIPGRVAPKTLPLDSLMWMIRTHYHHQSRDGREGIYFTDQTSVTIKNIPPGEYIFRVRAISKTGQFSEAALCTVTVHGKKSDDKPHQETAPILGMSNGVPNPFREKCIFFIQSEPGAWTSIEIYDALGRRVRTLYRGAWSGTLGSAVWNGCSDAGERVASGVYFCRVASGVQVVTKKIVLVD